MEDKLQIEQWMYLIPSLATSKIKMNIYAYLYNVQNNMRDYHPTQEHIAEIINVKHEPQISKAINDLVKDNLLIIVKKGVYASNPLFRRPNYYIVNVPYYVERYINKEEKEIKFEVKEVRESLDDVLSPAYRNSILRNYVRGLKINDDVKELLDKWLRNPTYTNSLIDTSLDRFKDELRELQYFCVRADGTIDWEEFKAHIERAYKNKGYKLIKKDDIPVKERNINGSSYQKAVEKSMQHRIDI